MRPALKWGQGYWIRLFFLCATYFTFSALTWGQEGSDSIGESTVVGSEFRLDILVVNIAQVRSTATAYTSIQAETERVRDLINTAYQDLLQDLERQRDALLADELDLFPEDFRLQTAELEQAAIDLEGKRRQNLSSLERRRQEILQIVDSRLNIVLTTLLQEAGATYIINQQSALVWPEAANVTDQAIRLLNEQLSQINFEVDLRIEGQNVNAQGDN